MATQLQIDTGFKLAGLINGRPTTVRDESTIYPLGYFRLAEIFTVEIVDQLLRNIGEDPNSAAPSPTKGFPYFLAVEILEFLESANLTVDGRRLDLTSTTSPDFDASFTDTAEYRRVLKRQIQSLKNQALRLNELPIAIVQGGGAGGDFTPTQDNLYPIVKRIMVEGTNTTLTEDDNNNTIAVNSTGGGSGGSFTPTQANLYNSVRDIIVPGTNTTITENNIDDTVAINLERVSTDSTLSGLGTPGDPLAVSVPFTSEQKTNLLNLLSLPNVVQTERVTPSGSFSARDPDPNSVLYQIIRDYDIPVDQNNNSFNFLERGVDNLGLIYDNISWDSDSRSSTPPRKMFSASLQRTTGSSTFTDGNWGLIIQINDEFFIRNSWQLAQVSASSLASFNSAFQRHLYAPYFDRNYMFSMSFNLQPDGRDLPITLVTVPDDTFTFNQESDGPFLLRNVWFAPNIKLLTGYLNAFGLTGMAAEDPIDFVEFRDFLAKTETGQDDTNLERVESYIEDSLDSYRIPPSRSAQTEVLKGRLEDEPFWEGINEVPDTPGTSTGIGHVLTVTGENDSDYAWRAPAGGSSSQPTGQVVYRRIGANLTNNSVFTILDNENTLFVEMDLTGTSNIATQVIRVMADGESQAYAIEEQSQRAAGFTLARSGNNFTVSNLVQIVSITVYSIRSSGVKGEAGDPGPAFTPSQENIYPSTKSILVPGVNTTLTEDDSANTIAVNVNIPPVTPFTPTQQNIYSAAKAILIPGTNTTLTENDTDRTIAVNSTSTAGDTTSKSDVYGFNKQIIRAGRNVTLSTDEANETITLSTPDIPRDNTTFAEPRFTPDYFLKNDLARTFTVHLDTAATRNGGTATMNIRGVVKTFTLSNDVPSYRVSITAADAANLNRAAGDGQPLYTRFSFSGNGNDLHTQLFATNSEPTSGFPLVHTQDFTGSSTRLSTAVEITPTSGGARYKGNDIQVRTTYRATLNDEYLITFSRLDGQINVPGLYSGPDEFIDSWYIKISRFAGRTEIYKTAATPSATFGGVVALQYSQASIRDTLTFRYFLRGAIAEANSGIVRNFRLKIYKLNS